MGSGMLAEDKFAAGFMVQSAANQLVNVFERISAERQSKETGRTERTPETFKLKLMMVD